MMNDPNWRPPLGLNFSCDRPKKRPDDYLPLSVSRRYPRMPGTPTLAHC